MWDRFFQKEFGKSGSQKFTKIENPTFGQNQFKIDANRLNMDLKNIAGSILKGFKFMLT